MIFTWTKPDATNATSENNCAVGGGQSAVVSGKAMLKCKLWNGLILESQATIPHQARRPALRQDQLVIGGSSDIVSRIVGSGDAGETIFLEIENA
jgi:hypothetical protein